MHLLVLIMNIKDTVNDFYFVWSLLLFYFFIFLFFDYFDVPHVFEIVDTPRLWQKITNLTIIIKHINSTLTLRLFTKFLQTSDITITTISTICRIR